MMKKCIKTAIAVFSLCSAFGFAVSASAALTILETAGFESGGNVSNAAAAVFDVNQGDVIAVVAAANNSVLPNDPSALSATGVDFTFQHRSSGAGPCAAFWYGTAVTNGSTEVLYTTTVAGNLSMGLYHLRCATGNVVQVIDAVTEGIPSATDLSAVYDFESTVSEAVILEAAAAYGPFQNLPALDANKGNVDKFIARHETVRNASGATNTYTLLEAKPIAIAGLAFAEGDSPLPLVAPSNSAIRYVGRFTDDYRFGWSGAMIETDFTGSKIQADFEFVADSEAGLTVIIDGTPRFLRINSSSTFTLAEDLEVGIRHRIQIFKRSEGALGTLKLNGLRITEDGELSLPDAPTLKMLVIGDSLTCGYGNEALTPSEGTSVILENGYMSYAPITARALGADLMMFCWSGRGIYRNGTGPALTNTIPLIFNQTLPEDSGPQWDHSNYIPDVIVINLGTNDKRTSDGREPIENFETEFKHEYTNFIGRLRGYYPDSKIVLSIGPNGHEPIDGWLPDIASNFTDTAVHLFPLYNGDDEKGGSYHPNVAKDISMAAGLTDTITTHFGWDQKKEFLLNYQFNELLNTDWTDATNRGTDTNAWNAANADALTDGAWHADINASADAYRSFTLAEPVTNGVLTVEFRVNNWNLANSVSGSGIQFGLNNFTAKTGFRSKTSTGETEILSNVSGNYRADYIDDLTHTNGYIDLHNSSKAVTVRMEVDMDVATGPVISTSFKPAGTAGFVTLHRDQAYPDATNGISVIKYFQEGSTAWDSADFIELDSLTVAVSPSGRSPAALWNGWLSDYPALGSDTNRLDNTDGDAWNNLDEYALGGNPTVSDSTALCRAVEAGGTNYMEFIYPRRVDAAFRGLRYQLSHTTNLVNGIWMTNKFQFCGSGIISPDFEAVTNRLSTASQNQQFINLQIEL